jgi:hypothetical protein
VAAGIAIGMVDDDRVALARPGGAVFWLDIGTTKPVLGSAIAMPAAEPALPLAIGGGRTIGAHDSQLVISTPGTNHYLGYQLPSPAVASAAPSGGLLLGLGTTFALLDPTLVASRTAPDLMIPGGSTVADLRWLGGDEWVVESSRAKDGVSAISLVDTRRKTSVLVRDGMAEVQMLRYEPSTKLVTLSLGDQPQVLRHEPGNRSTRSRVAKVSALSMPVGTAEIFPLAPQLAGGVHLVVVHAHHGVTIRWVAEPRALDRGVTQVGVALANVDAAGHVFVWQSLPDSRLELVVYANGKRVGTLPSDGPIEVFPDRAGERVLQIGQRNLSLVTLDGATVWTQSIHGVREALWLDDGGLAVISAAGVARLDPATGEVVAARCGWHFGLEDKPHPPASHLEPLCTQLR